MAKKKPIKRGEHLFLEMSKCKECKGNPPLVDGELPDFTYKKCSICYRVDNYVKK